MARREFSPDDLDGVWLVVAAATPEVNRGVARAAEPRRIFVNAVDDPANATAFLSGVVRRDGVTVAISTSGDAPGLTALVREALDALLPLDLGRWMAEARRVRAIWKRDQVPMEARKPLLLDALNDLYRPDEVSRPMTGRVSLVGAGPGDPGLLTRTAVARLRAADLVLYDALVDERILKIARRAQRFFVGKRAGRHALSQEDIHAVMIRAAKRGRARRAAEGRRSVRLRPRRRRSAGASGRRRAVRCRAGRDERVCRARRRGHPGDASRAVGRGPRGQRPRRGGLRVGRRRARAVTASPSSC